MRKYFLSICIVFLVSCSNSIQLDEDASNLFEKTEPLLIDFQAPESILVQKSIPFELVLKQNNHYVDNVDVQLSFWEKDNTAFIDTLHADYLGNGKYMVNKIFEEKGIYYLQIQASSKASTILPTAQLIVGELSEEEITNLNKSIPPSQDGHSHSDHH